jgi:hypothetical protein
MNLEAEYGRVYSECYGEESLYVIQEHMKAAL